MTAIDTTSYYDSLTAPKDVGVVETNEDNTSLTSDDFITLLLAQLEYQDPTEPVDNAQMVDQLNGFSQLEELTEMNDTLAELTDNLNSMTASNGLDYLGKQVEADGYTVAKNGDDVSSLTFNLPENADSVACNVYDSTGAIVDTASFSNMSAGSHQFNWNGTDHNGAALEDGVYAVIVSATNGDGETVDVDTSTSGLVTGVASTDNGVMLSLEDGRTVNMLDVTHATL